MTDLFTDDQPEITFDDLVGEGKKYRDTDAVAKALAEKDRFIKQLEEENATARQELRSRTNLEDIVNQLKTEQRQIDPQPNREISQPPRQEPIVEEPSEDLETKIAEILKSKDAEKTRMANIETARSGLRERFGADYNQTLRSIVNELSVSEKFIMDLAATSPQGFFKLVDSVKAPDDKRPTTPPQSKAPGVLPNTSGRRNKAYYDELRRTDINLYLSPRTQNQYYRDAMEQGDAFYK